VTPVELAALNRAVARLLDRWQASDETGARILALDLERYLVWKRGELRAIDDDLKLRLVLLLRIHVELQALFISPVRRDGWMNRCNALFGQTPLGLIAGSGLAGILRLQAYLAAENAASI
jgi:hypothetical protein